MGGREGENRLGSPQWWISSEACFITRLPVWRSAGKSRPCGAAAEIYGSLIISTNTFQYSIVQYTAPTLLPRRPEPDPRTLSILPHQVLWLQVCDHESPAANTRFVYMHRTNFSQVLSCVGIHSKSSQKIHSITNIYIIFLDNFYVTRKTPVPKVAVQTSLRNMVFLVCQKQAIDAESAGLKLLLWACSHRCISLSTITEEKRRQKPAPLPVDRCCKHNCWICKILLCIIIMSLKIKNQSNN